jgi:hypothetical protein
MTEPPRWIEPATAILLSFAGLASGWASYQASLWGGTQASQYAIATSTMTQASALAIIDGQRTGADAMLFMAWFESAADGDAKRMAFYEKHFTPAFRAIFDPWRAKFPADLRAAELRADVPPGLPAVVHGEGLRAAELRSSADAAFAAGETANRHSDYYVASTVILSIVLFLAGISASLNRIRVRAGVILLAAVLCVIATGLIATLPVQPL